MVENARGYLYGFHRLTGMGGLALGDAVDLLREAGHHEIADRIDRELVGRNVIEGRWTFQIVEDYDDGYYALFKQLEAGAREQLVGGRRHLFEAEMKEEQRTHGARHHEAAPEPRTGQPRQRRAAGGRRLVVGDRPPPRVEPSATELGYLFAAPGRHVARPARTSALKSA